MIAVCFTSNDSSFRGKTLGPTGVQLNRPKTTHLQTLAYIKHPYVHKSHATWIPTHASVNANSTFRKQARLNKSIKFSNKDYSGLKKISHNAISVINGGYYMAARGYELYLPVRDTFSTRR